MLLLLAACQFAVVLPEDSGELPASYDLPELEVLLDGRLEGSFIYISPEDGGKDYFSVEAEFCGPHAATNDCFGTYALDFFDGLPDSELVDEIEGPFWLVEDQLLLYDHDQPQPTSHVTVYETPFISLAFPFQYGELYGSVVLWTSAELEDYRD